MGHLSPRRRKLRSLAKKKLFKCSGEEPSTRRIGAGFSGIGQKLKAEIEGWLVSSVTDVQDSFWMHHETFGPFPFRERMYIGFLCV